jgi:hypothetical protein
MPAGYLPAFAAPQRAPEAPGLAGTGLAPANQTYNNKPTAMSSILPHTPLFECRYRSRANGRRRIAAG